MNTMPCCLQATYLPRRAARKGLSTVETSISKCSGPIHSEAAAMKQLIGTVDGESRHILRFSS